MANFEEMFVFIEEYLNANISAIKLQNEHQKIQNENIESKIQKKVETIEGQFKDGLSQLDDKVSKVENRTDKLENNVFPENISEIAKGLLLTDYYFKYYARLGICITHFKFGILTKW
jgi:X-X-X-Leu-X-X-Gly heptad repeat protein